MVWLAKLLPGLTVSGIWAPFLATLGMAAVNLSFSDLLSIDDDDSYYHHLLSDITNLYGKLERSETPGVLFLEIDGLSEPTLRRAIRDGHMPTFARWLESGSHKLVGWECDLSSQTSASQAGILLGNNFDIPAFRWYEKDTGRQMVSNYPKDTAEIERRLSSGRGLLAREGASRSNLFSGDAPQAIFTFSTLTDVSKHSTQDFYPLFMGLYNFLRMVSLFLWDVLLELRAARYQRRHNVRPRIHRGGVYPLLRAATTILLRELNLFVLIGDMYAGVPCVYTTFLGYDEVAHHSGVERPDALDILHKLDEQFDRLERVANLTSRPYQFVVLSDHGQSQGATFKQRYDMTLEDLVRKLVSAEHTVESIEAEDAGWNNLSVFLTDILHDVIPGDDHLVSRLFRRVVKDFTINVEEILTPYRQRFEQELERLEPAREYFDERCAQFEQVVFGPYRQFLERVGNSQEQNSAEVVVLSSGNLGLIYFTDWSERMSYEQINEAFPNIVSGLAKHEGIGFVLVHSEEYGPMAIGGNSKHYLADGRVDGEDPLANFPHNAAAHLRRTDSFPHVADIMVNSFYDPELGEVAAFEELVGSHGGLGGDQTKPFLLYPAEWDIDDDIVGAAALHVQLKHWLNQYSTQPFTAQ